MRISQAPFNLDLLILKDEEIRHVTPVTVLDTMEGKTKNFHPNGLFSTEIFGKVGNEVRNRQFSYINLKATIFHPIIYKAICDLKSLYSDLLAGNKYAIWDDNIKDFIKATPLTGNTGYSFFLEHFKDIQFEERLSSKRENNIKLVNKYRNNCLMNKLIVLPAGLRDYEYSDAGQPSQDEVNTLYRQVMSLANLITEASLKVSPAEVDNVRYKMQKKVNEIYYYFEAMLNGKKKLVLGKWASRKIYNGTRNVITSLNNNTDNLDSPTLVSFNQTTIGLYQFLKATLPVAIHHIRNTLYKVFPGPNMPAILVNKKTLKKELVHLDPKYYDEWMTNEGLEQVITRFGLVDLRNIILDTPNHYLGLIYRGPDMTYKFLQDIDELPDDRSKDDVHPITFAELLYISVYHFANDLPLFFTRYPVINYGSIYPSKTFLKSTVNSEIRTMLDDNWHKTDRVALQYPILDSQFVDSMSPHPAHLLRLDAFN
jgi:hypothetical protein